VGFAAAFGIYVYNQYLFASFYKKKLLLTGIPTSAALVFSFERVYNVVYRKRK